MLYQLLSLATSVLAFYDTQPELIKFENAKQVPTLKTAVELLQKQYIFELTSNSNSSPTASQSGSATSTQSIQTETVTAGMTYLYSDSSNESFYVNITIESVNYPVLLDTGSPYLWIYSSNCTSSACETDSNKNNLFEYNQGKNLESKFELSYDEGYASGLIYEDEVIIGGFKAPDFKFGVADIVPNIFDPYNFVGVLGLPADNSSVTGLVNAVSYLAENGDITSSKFIICMGEYLSDEKNDGILFFGDTKEILHTGDIYTASILKDAISHWEFKIDNVYINSFQVEFDELLIDETKSNYSRIGLLDSGTTSIVLSKNDALTLHSYFTNSFTDGTNYAIYCNSTLDINLEISGKNWTISSDEYIGSAYGDDSELAGYCVSNFQGLDSTSDGAWILGILFMKGKYVEFDYENQWIGLAERNNEIKFVNPPQNTSLAATATTIQTISTSLTATAMTTTATKTSSITTAHNSSVHNFNFNRVLNLIAWSILLI